MTNSLRSLVFAVISAFGVAIAAVQPARALVEIDVNKGVIEPLPIAITDFLSSDGEKAWRKRDEEFEPLIQNKDQLLEKWNAGWNCLFGALQMIDAQNFNTVVYIRNQGHTIAEAINRQLAHYAYHVGQIVYIGRMIGGKNWQSLSIPKGGSKAFNAEKFSKEKKKEHFTDEFFKES